MQNLILIFLTFDAISVHVLWASARGECIAFNELSKMIFLFLVRDLLTQRLWDVDIPVETTHYVYQKNLC